MAAVPGFWQTPSASSEFPVWVAEAQSLETLSAAFPGALQQGAGPKRSW